MGNPWFRMYTDFMFNETIEFLAFEDQRHFVFVLCMKNAGLLDKQYPKEGMLDRVVARRLGLFGEAFDNAKKRIMEVGLIDENWQPKNWESRQFISDTDPTHAQRQRKYREKKKNSVTTVTRDVTRDVTVTPLDTDTESDKPSNTDVLLVASVADDAEKKPDCPHQEIIALYHQILPACHRIVDWTPNRSKVLKARWDENRKRQNLEYWKGLFEYIAKCPFLVGRAGNKPFLASLDWICKAENFAKIREGRYEVAA